MTDAEAQVERWVYDDDELGHIEVVIGFYGALRSIDPGWPEAKNSQDPAGAGTGGTSAWNRQPGDLAGQWAARSSARIPGLASRARTMAENGEKGMLVTVGGTTVARCRTVTSHRAALDGEVKDGKFSDYPAPSTDRVQIRANGLTHEVLDVYVHRKTGSGQDIVALAPPPGSRGERRAEAMEASPWKRVAYPLAGGFGKAGWAVAMLVLLPFIGRLVGWLWGWSSRTCPRSRGLTCDCHASRGRTGTCRRSRGRTSTCRTSRSRPGSRW